MTTIQKEIEERKKEQRKSFLIAEIKGKQYEIIEGKTIKVDFIEELEIGNEYKIDDILLSKNDTDIKIGSPRLDSSAVAECIEQKKDKKVLVFKYKSGKDYRKTQGHRQNYTYLKIKKVNF